MSARGPTAPPRDTAQLRAAGIVWDGIAAAHGFHADSPDEPGDVCSCGHHFTAHHGPHGEGRCADCPCPAFEATP